MAQQTRKGDGWDFIREKERKSQLYLFTSRTALEKQDAFRDKEVAALKAKATEEINATKDRNIKLHNRIMELEDALIELIQVKDWKDKNGKDEHYEKAQPLAWENARKAIDNSNNQQ